LKWVVDTHAHTHTHTHTHTHIHTQAGICRHRVYKRWVLQVALGLADVFVEDLNHFFGASEADCPSSSAWARKAKTKREKRK